MAKVTCDGCRETIDGARVVITTEASDEDGVNVAVTKRWILCRSCGDGVFSRIGEASPWVDDDFKTVVMPDDEMMSQHAGGYAAQIS